MDAESALLAAHPDDFDAVSAAGWVRSRRALLVARTTPADTARSASSGCAVSGAHRHASAVAADAAHALARWDAGTAVLCELCDEVLPLARLEAVPSAVRCTACAPVSTVDTRWCR